MDSSVNSNSTNPGSFGIPANTGGAASPAPSGSQAMPYPGPQTGANPEPANAAPAPMPEANTVEEENQQISKPDSKPAATNNAASDRLFERVPEGQPMFSEKINKATMGLIFGGAIASVIFLIIGIVIGNPNLWGWGFAVGTVGGFGIGYVMDRQTRGNF